MESGSQTHTSSGRIATNTIVLFARMLVLMVVNLYAVRVVLAQLGAEDYGIFNVVAGVTTCTVFVSGVLDLSLQRFYSVAMGRGEAARLRDIFSIGMLIVLLLAAAIIVLFETGGLWAINCWLDIPAARMPAANICYQAAVFTFICSFLQMPYTAAIFAHEDMNAYALISAAECLLKLLAALAIAWTALDGLVVYSVALLAVALLVLTTYAIFARRHYPECHYRHCSDRKLARSIISFSGWTTLGTFSKMCMVQGSTIVLNLFFGPLTNAAFAISTQVSNAFNSVCNSMVLALRPQMMKSYAAGDNDRLVKLFFLSNKFILYTLLIVSVPVISEMGSILLMWLGAGRVSEEMIAFSRLSVISVILLALSNPITAIVQATGKIRDYHIVVEGITMLCLPLSWLMFRLGMQSYCVYVSMICVLFAAHIARLFLLRREYSSLSLSAYSMSFALPAAIITAAVWIATMLVHSHILLPLLRFVAVGATSTMVIAALAYVIGLSREERIMIAAWFRTSKLARLWTTN